MKKFGMLERIRPMIFLRSLNIVFSLVLIFLPADTYALVSADYSVTPVVFDVKGSARDILKQTITIVNTSNHRIDLYPSVYDIDVKEGAEEFVSAQGSGDRKDSLANWIELSRGVLELGPGEEKEIPFIIRVNFNAIPGAYHAVISFSEGRTRGSAVDTGIAASATVNMEVKSDEKESMQLSRFFSETFFFSGDDVLLNYQLENTGNKNLQPKGEVSIYDRKGREVATLIVNEDGKVVHPAEQAQLASVWTAANGFGKYKAFLNINYGTNQNAAVQDTVFFWIVPWQQLLGLFTGSMIVLILFALYFHRWIEQRHLGKLALAGAVNVELVPQAGGLFGFGKQIQPVRSMQEVIEAPVIPRQALEERRGILSLFKWKMVLSSLFMFRKRKMKTQDVVEKNHVDTQSSVRSLRQALGTNPNEKLERAHVSSQLAREAYGGSMEGTINLKQHLQQKTSRSEDAVHHVINLKNRS